MRRPSRRRDHSQMSSDNTSMTPANEDQSEDTSKIVSFTPLEASHYFNEHRDQIRPFLEKNVLPELLEQWSGLFKSDLSPVTKIYRDMYFTDGKHAQEDAEYMLVMLHIAFSNMRDGTLEDLFEDAGVDLAVATLELFAGIDVKKLNNDWFYYKQILGYLFYQLACHPDYYRKPDVKHQDVYEFLVESFSEHESMQNLLKGSYRVSKRPSHITLH